VRDAGRGFFPLDERWGLDRSDYSPERAKQMVWLSGLLPYQQAAQVFERIGRCQIPATSIWRQAQHHGERLKQHQERQQEQVSVERVVLPPPGLDHQRRKGVSMDGGKMHIRDEGWKEFKVGTVYDVETRAVYDQEMREWVELGRGVNIAYTSVLGSKDEFASALWALAVEHDIPQAADVSVTADGADWIWNLTADYFPDSMQIVDWYHAGQHVAQAAQALHADDEVAAHRWNKQRRRDMYLGAIHRITTPLDHAGLQSYAQYFHTHKRRMQYQEFREQGYPIGSGTVESGIKQFKTRLTGPGMRWSRAGAQRMLVIRAAVMTGNFDHVWALAPN
jgi:hypothetical protein